MTGFIPTLFVSTVLEREAIADEKTYPEGSQPSYPAYGRAGAANGSLDCVTRNAEIQ
jgi:hypothetical protein